MHIDGLAQLALILTKYHKSNHKIVVFINPKFNLIKTINYNQVFLMKIFNHKFKLINIIILLMKMNKN